jgi:flavin reductase (DIM6/NTAB) family NADH-FMN oxidoreductase RutF
MGRISNPNQIVLVTSRYKDKDNVMAVTWWTKVSFEPNLYLICIDKRRYSHKLIDKGKSFVINFMPFELKEKILFCGKNSGRDIDKFKEAGLEKSEAEKINCPVIKECLSYVECKVIKKISAGDHTIFLGKVLNAKFKKKGKRAFQLDKDKFTTTIE